MFPAFLTNHSFMQPPGSADSTNLYCIILIESPCPLLCKTPQYPSPAKLFPFTYTSLPNQVPMATFSHQDPCWAPSAKASYQDIGTGPQ